MSQVSAGFQELLNTSFEHLSSGIHTAIPGIVVSVVNASTQTINVKPTINVRGFEGDPTAERPSVLNVQYHNPVSSQGGLTFPVAVGDPVFLIFSMRGLDVWRAGNNDPAPPSDLRRFDLNDCVAIPGITPPSISKSRPSSRSNAHDPADVVLVHNIGTGNEVEIRLKKNGDVIVNTPNNVIVNADQDVEVNCVEATVIASDQVTLDTPDTLLTGNLTVQGTMAIEGNGGSGVNTINGNFNIVGSVLTHNSKNIGSNHTHTGVESGGDTSGPPA